MLTLLGALLGLVSSTIPAIMKYFTQKEDNKQELAVMDLQMKQQAKQHEYKLEEIQIEADAAEMVAMRQEFANRKPTYKWVEMFISMVRPTLTYSYFALYAGVKVSYFLVFQDAGLEMQSILPRIWHDQDTAIFATIISFWFGHRMMSKPTSRS